MIYDTKRIKKEAERDFFSAWKNTKNQYPPSDKAFEEKLLKHPKPDPHPIPNTIQKIRSSFLRLGFKEVENPLFIEEQDVYKQYGPEAPAILDRCYYLAGIPRPDIGLSDAKIRGIKKTVPTFGDPHKKALKGVLRDYKLGRIEGDDLVEAIEQKLGVPTEEATKIISLFDELRNLKAEPTKTTLRSHMTAAWFPTIRALQDKMEHPLKLFSIGLRFRREQRVDSTHLRAHYGASCAICDESMNLDAGKAITAEILKPLGFKEFTYRLKKATSTYYARDSEFEVFSKSGGVEIEVADFGMYSPIALAQYDIRYPTFNVGFGIERILMIREGLTDVREVMFPQFYALPELTDAEIADAITINKGPQTQEGRELSKAIQKTAAKNANAKSPCEFEAFSGKFLNRKITASIVEEEGGTMLLGPAALNEIYVYDGGIYGLPREGFKGKTEEIKKNGIKTGITYLAAISDYFAAGIEDAIKDIKKHPSPKPYYHQFKMAKTAPDINIKIPEAVLRYLQSKNRALMLKGPIFTAVRASIK